MKNILFGMTGGIACYKAADLVNKLAHDYNVDVIMTENSTKFITPLTIQTLSKNMVVVDMFQELTHYDVQHISLAEKADLAIIAPATANFIGKLANGIADDMLTTTVMACKCPIIICPAMNTAMYENKMVQDNIAKLKNYNYIFVDPAYGKLACGTSGQGKLAKIDDILNRVNLFMGGK